MKLPSAAGNSSQKPPNGLFQHCPGAASAAGAHTNPPTVRAAAQAEVIIARILFAKSHPGESDCGLVAWFPIVFPPVGGLIPRTPTYDVSGRV
jgi:hypothetical protein